MEKHSSLKKNKHQKNGADTLGIFIEEFLQEFIIMFSMGLWSLLKSFFTKNAFLTIPLVFGGAYVCLWYSSNAFHLAVLNELAPDLFTQERLNKTWQYPLVYHFGAVYGLYITPLVLIIGSWVRSIRTKFQKIFLKVGLTNALGETPKLLKERRLDKYRRQYIFDACAIGKSEFEAKKERVESYFKKNIESIKHGKHNGQVVITFTTQIFPEKVSYVELTAQKILPAESIYLGMSSEGIITQSISELPHMLIAGTTGSGKSIFFKQALLGLLESSPHLQMYLIDLKGGLEMIDFVKSPNVKVIKDLRQAVDTLRLVEKEMKKRFSYLEKAGKKQIIPKIDKKDRIVVAVDEASVLYMNRSRLDPDYDLAVAARGLADSISKLSRAAAIHLLLATQKLDKEVIPTSVSENISGRMAFRANSLQGSLIVLGTKDAMELPEIPGRGIWNFGTKKIIIQAPYVDEKTIKKKCDDLLDMYTQGRKKMFNPMIGEVEKEKENKIKNVFYDDTKKD